MASSVITMPSITVVNKSAANGSKIPARLYWSKYIGRGIVPLFEKTGTYTEEQQASHLKFLSDVVAPDLGPLPTDPHPQYTMPYVGAPLEFSLNLSSTGKAKARMTFEVVGPADKTGPDPFGEDLSREILRRQARAVGANTQWLESVIDSTFLTPEETQVVRAQGVPPFVPSSMWAYDFDGSKRSMKAYFASFRKAMATGKSGTEVLLDAIRCLDDGLKPGLDLYTEYLNERKGKMNVVLLGIDCIDPKDARVKIYTNVKANSWESVVDFWTLGGRLNDETTLKGLEIVRSIFPILMDEPDILKDETWCKPERIKGIPFNGLQFSVELAPGRALPEIKLYVPMCQYNRNTQVLQKNVEAALKKMNHEWGHNGKYMDAMKAVFPGEDDFRGIGFITFSYSKKKGAYTTSYLMLPTEHGEQELSDSTFEYN
ncbi:hypothetical protein SLS53_001083 [Cytospora paraplurivora]|uniref:Aromatic prenyltransferase n=1 Tax=Cytospora paraplurivora TaxID=2898453 RepID=A0AAN9UGC1_9PEZI